MEAEKSLINDVFNLLRKQAWVDGVGNITTGTNTVIRLEMAVIIPGQGGDATTVLQSPTRYHIGQLPGAPNSVLVGVAVTRVICCYRNDFHMGINPFGALQIDVTGSGWSIIKPCTVTIFPHCY